MISSSVYNNDVSPNPINITLISYLLNVSL
jgi:hypothetical protein